MRGGATRGAEARWVALFACATVFVVVIGGTTLPVALPEIGAALSLGPSALGWIITGYFLLNGVAVPFFGRLADIYGVRGPYSAGLLLYFVGSVVCVFAPVYPVLIAGRLAQEIGAAAVVGLAPTSVSLAYPPERRGAAVGYVWATAGVAAAMGPVVGGVVTEVLG